jgi:adenine-specific DNA-methyltransferase
VNDCKLIQGDCLDVMRTLKAGSVDAVVTDPPFKLSQEYGTVVDADNLLAVSSVWGAATEMARLARPGGVCAMFYDTRILPVALRAMAQAGWKYLRGLTFYRRWGQASMLHGWMSTSDFILLFQKPGARPKFYGSARHDVYLRASPEPEFTGHVAQKPLDAVTHLVERLCPPGGVVLDPYAGSGTTGVACARAGRKFIGIEMDPEYFKAARRRLAAATRGVAA